MESCDLAAESPSSPETPADIVASGTVRRNQATSRGKRQTHGSHSTRQSCVENTAISKQDEGWESPSEENNCVPAVAVPNDMTSTEASSVIEPANMIASSSVVLDIVCGINRAKLYVEGLRNGSKTASVLLTSDISEQLKAGMWVTPNQFQHASGRGTARDWKRSIKHHGTSLKALLSSRTLSVEPAQCRCPVCSGVVSASSSAAVENDAIPLNLSTESTETESLVIPCRSGDDDDELLEKPEEGEDRIKLKRQMMSALSLLDVNQAAQPSYLWRLPEVVPSSAASKRPASLDWDWNQLQYSGPNTERKRAKKEETTITHHHHQQQVTRAVTSSSGVTSAGTSLFDFVVMTSFTDAYIKFRSQRAPKQQHHGVQNTTDMKGASYDDVIDSVVSKSRDECEQKSTTVTEKRLKTTDSQRVGSQHMSTNAKAAVIERDCSSSASVSAQESPRDAKKRSVQRHEVTSSVRANAVVTSSSAAAAIDAVSAVSNKQLPDLVQSALPTGTMTPSNVGLLPSTALLTTSLSEMISYPVDSIGALDLSPSTTRQLMAAAVALMVQRQRAAIDLSKWSAWNSAASLAQPDDQLTLDLRGWPAAVANTSESEVLDLSCKPSDQQQPRQPEKSSSVLTDVVKNPQRNQTKVKIVSATDASLPPAPGHVTPASSHPDNDNPLSWGVRDVIEFVSEVPGCQIYAETFKRFGVRGSSLPVLTVDHMTDILRMDAEAAKSLRLAIERMLTSYASSDKPAKFPAVEASSATELALHLVDLKPNL